MSFSDYFWYRLDEKEVYNKNSMYIAHEFDKKVVKRFYDEVDLKQAEVVETRPHMTFMYSPKVENISKKKLLEISKEHLNGFKYNVTLNKYSQFKGVSEGKQDVLIVEIIADEDTRKKQADLIKAIKGVGGTPEFSYSGGWKPHMTIMYTGLDQIKLDKLPKIEPMEVSVDKMFFQFGGSDQEKHTL